MQHTLTGFRWEGVACLVSFAAAALVLYVGVTSPVALTLVLVLSLLGVCFGLSHMRTWRRAYQNIVLAALLVAAVAYYLVLLLPSK
jgi:uncharacterized membrane protein